MIQRLENNATSPMKTQAHCQLISLHHQPNVWDWKESEITHVYSLWKVTAFLIDPSYCSDHPTITAHAFPNLGSAQEFTVCIGSNGGPSVKCETPVYNGMQCWSKHLDNKVKHKSHMLLSICSLTTCKLPLQKAVSNDAKSYYTDDIYGDNNFRKKQKNFKELKVTRSSKLIGCQKLFNHFYINKSVNYNKAETKWKLNIGWKPNWN